jgi:hypothetical protein
MGIHSLTAPRGVIHQGADSTPYTEIDGITRFPSARQFFSYCRLVPGAELRSPPWDYCDPLTGNFLMVLDGGEHRSANGLR